MDIHRATWNRQQKKLKAALSHPEAHPEWLELFLHQHAQVHSSRLSPDEGWSFEDEVTAGLDEGSMRDLPTDGEHSIAWILFHLARIEDITMNMLVAGEVQLTEGEDWLERMRAPIMDSGNAKTKEDVIELSQMIDITVLLEYRLTVGRCTHRLVSQLTPAELKMPVDARRLEKVRSRGAVVAAAGQVLEYWSKRTIAGLLLMPATRHCVLHLNEALRIKHELIG